MAAEHDGWNEEENLEEREEKESDNVTETLSAKKNGEIKAPLCRTEDQGDI